MYTIKEISDLLQVSKVTLYKKLKLKEMEPYIVKRNSITYVDAKGLEVLKNFLILKEDLQEALKNTKCEADAEMATTIENEELKELTEDYLTFLKSQLQEKDKQLQERDNQINELLLRLSESNKLIENSQILIREKEEQPTLILEEHFQELDEKLELMRERLEERKHEKKRFWSKLKK